MKYEAIKKQVAQNVYSMLEQGRGGDTTYAAAVAAMFDAIAERRPFEQSMKALADKCYNIIMNWDIRMVGKLRELFPVFFPASLRTGKLQCDYDGAGDWIVFKVES